MKQSHRSRINVRPTMEPTLGQPANSLAVLLHRMIDRIRQSLELSEILAATVTEVRSFLGTDRVKVYRFDADGSGKVIAESIQAQRLPSLLGHHFPASDIPPEARELFLKARQRSIVDVTAQQIGVSPLVSPETGQSLTSDIRFRPVDPCHVDYLTAMGVQSSLAIPILYADQLWGLLVSHHRAPYWIRERDLQILQLVADQVSVAIAHATLLNQARLQTQHELTLNRVLTLLHALPEIRFQEALEQMVTALKGCGGRLYRTAPVSHQASPCFTCGQQPTVTRSSMLEQHPDWDAWLEIEPTIDPERTTWVISNLWQSAIPSELLAEFQATSIRGILIVRLQHHQQVLGYLSIFRSEIEVEVVWAGRPDANDPRQLRPRQSFATWRELKQGQAHVWSANDHQLARSFGHHLTMTLYQSTLYEQVCSLNAELERRVYDRTLELQQANIKLRDGISERDRVLRERQQARDSLKRLSRQHELILNSAGEGIYGLNLQGKTTFINPAAARMLGYEIEVLLEQFMHPFLMHTQADGTPYAWEQSPIFATLYYGTIHHITSDRFGRRDGSSFAVEYVSTPIREQGKILGVVVIFKDITERQMVERMKDEFVSVVSHELRTPLTSIRAALGLLARGALNTQPDKHQRMLEIASSNTNRLVRLVNDILDIERIRFGKVAMEMQVCDAAELMTQAVDVMQAMAEKAEIKLAVTPLSVPLQVDPDRIIQTLTNLISNAIKFSPPHTTIQITAKLATAQDQERTPDPASRPSVQFQVTDQGRGIPSDKLETIFAEFQQLDASDSGHQGGTGLGLAICRSIIQQHGGQIWAESTLGAGSTFYFTLPVSAAEDDSDD
jgi:PAS domain S-box-containing protein